jgi:hypothetical protein
MLFHHSKTTAVDRPRSARPKAWSDRAAAEARAAGLSGIEIAKAVVAASSGGERWRINHFKHGVECLIRGYAKRPNDAMHLFGDLVRFVLPAGITLDGAIAEIEREYRADLAWARGLERCSILETRAHDRIAKLKQLRLILRLMRRFAGAEAFAEVRDVVAEPHPLVAQMQAFHHHVRPWGR